GRAGLELDHGLHRLAPLLVRHADHRAVLHRGMAPQHLLDLAGEDVEAAGDDHVLLAIDDVDEAVLVDNADVAGMVPAEGRGLARRGLVVVVAQHDQAAAHHDLAALAARQDTARLVHHLHPHPPRAPPAARHTVE